MKSNFKIKHLYLVIIYMLFIRCAHLKEAHTLHSDGDYGSSITLCLKAIKTDTTDTEAYALLSRNYRASESLVQALRTIRLAEIRKLQSKKLTEESGLISLAFGDRAYHEKDKLRALKHYQAAREKLSADTTLIKVIADINIELGKLSDAGKDILSLSRLTEDTLLINTRLKIIKSRVESAEKQLAKGLNAYQNNRLETALNILSETRKLRSDSDDINYYYYMAKGRTLYLKGMYAYKKGAVNNLWDAIELFGKAGAIDKKNPEPHYYTGMAYEKKDKEEYLNAIAAYEKSLKLDPVSIFAEKCKIQVQKLKVHKKRWTNFTAVNDYNSVFYSTLKFLRAVRGLRDLSPDSFSSVNQHEANFADIQPLPSSSPYSTDTFYCTLHFPVIQQIKLYSIIIYDKINNTGTCFTFINTTSNLS